MEKLPALIFCGAIFWLSVFGLAVWGIGSVFTNDGIEDAYALGYKNGRASYAKEVNENMPDLAACLLEGRE